MGASREHPEAQTEALSRRQRILLPTLVFTGLVIAMVSSLGAPLVPTIAKDNGVSLSTGEWVLTAALLTGALATPVLGRLADGPRQRQVVAAALGATLAGCVLAAVSSDFALLVLGRGLQGIGLGLLPVTMAIARRQLPFAQASRGIATLSVTAAVGVGLGYPVTGLIVQHWSYHAAYWFGAVVVLGALVADLLVLPAATEAVWRPFDVFGATTLGIAVVGISVVLTEGGAWGWGSTASVALGIASILVVALWIFHELRFSHPLVELRQLRNRSVLTADVTGFIMSVAIFLLSPIIVEFVQVPSSEGFGFGASIPVAGLVLLPLSVGTYTASRFLSAYERRFGVRSLIPLGALVYAAGALYFAFEHRSLWEAFVALGIAGLGLGFTFAAMPGFIIRSVPQSDTGSATGFYQVLRNIGMTLGSSLTAAVLLGYTHHGQTYPSEGGFQAALIIGAALGVVSAIVAWVLPGKLSTMASLDPDELAEVELRMEEEAELAGTGAMLVDERELDEPGGH
jgi:MFS family permease